MKLSSQDVERTLAQFNAEPVPNDHPVIEDLRNSFGDHTFFLHQNGLHIVEPGRTLHRGRSYGTRREAREVDGCKQIESHTTRAGIDRCRRSARVSGLIPGCQCRAPSARPVETTRTRKVRLERKVGAAVPKPG